MNTLAGPTTARRSPRPGTLTLPGTLTAARLKVTITLNATELLAVRARDDKPHITLRIRLSDRTITAEIAAKSLRKAQRAIREASADRIALVLQGHLVRGDVIAEAGLSAQPKAAKPVPRSQAAIIQHGLSVKWVEGVGDTPTHETEKL
jgi:hypothetical protein